MNHIGGQSSEIPTPQRLEVPTSQQNPLPLENVPSALVEANTSTVGGIGRAVKKDSSAAISPDVVRKSLDSSGVPVSEGRKINLAEAEVSISMREGKKGRFSGMKDKVIAAVSSFFKYLLRDYD